MGSIHRILKCIFLLMVINGFTQITIAEWMLHTPFQSAEAASSAKKLTNDIPKYLVVAGGEFILASFLSIFAYFLKKSHLIALFVFVFLGIAFSTATLLMACEEKEGFTKFYEVHRRRLLVVGASGAGIIIGIFGEMVILIALKSCKF